MDTEAELVRLIRTYPEEDEWKLRLADWLEENGRERDGWVIRYHLLHKAPFLRRFYRDISARSARPS